jgi:hypothetical protein
MMSSYQRRLDIRGYDSLRHRVDQLRTETDTAQYEYRSALLDYGSPQSQDYWPTAYMRLIEKANVIVGKMRDAAVVLPFVERYQVAADVEMLEHLVDDWTQSMRRSMAAAVA